MNFISYKTQISINVKVKHMVRNNHEGQEYNSHLDKYGEITLLCHVIHDSL